jgi:hypothetical protein
MGYKSGTNCEVIPIVKRIPKVLFRVSKVYNNQNQTRLMKLNEKKSESLSVLFTSLNSKILKIPKNIHHFRSIFFINNNNNKKKKKEKEKDHSPLLVLPDAAT